MALRFSSESSSKLRATPNRVPAVYTAAPCSDSGQDWALRHGCCISAQQPHCDSVQHTAPWGRLRRAARSNPSVKRGIDTHSAQQPRPSKIRVAACSPQQPLCTGRSCCATQQPVRDITFCTKPKRCPGGEIGPDRPRNGPRFVALEDPTPGRTGQTICMIYCFGGFKRGASEQGVHVQRYLRNVFVNTKTL